MCEFQVHLGFTLSYEFACDRGEDLYSQLVNRTVIFCEHRIKGGVKNYRIEPYLVFWDKEQLVGHARAVCEGINV